MNTAHRGLVAALADNSRALLRAPDRATVFADACRIAVETGGFRMAWIGWLDPATGRFDVAASAGATGTYLDEIVVSAGDVPEGRGPIGESVREQRPVVIADTASDPRFAPWRDAALAHGYASAASFPLLQDDEALGVLAVYAGTADAFDDDTVPLLEELAADISFGIERLRLEAEGVLANSRYRRFVDHSVEGIFRTTLDGRLLEVNPALAAMLGYASPQDMLASVAAVPDLYADPGEREAVLAEIGATGRLVGRDVHIKHAGGGVLVLAMYARLLNAAEDGVDGLEGMVSDVTERRMLEEQQARLAAIVTSAEDAILSLSHDGHITSWNAGAKRIFGFTAAEAVGKHIRLIVPDDRLDELLDLHARLHSGQQVAGLETARVRRGGERITVSLSLSPIFGPDGELREMSAIERDVTDEVETRDQLRRYATELERSNRELQEFAYVASHDLQEPLRMVTGFLGLIRQRYEGQLDDEADEFIGFAVDGAQRMQRLIQDLLEYSRVQTRGREPEPCDVGTALEQALRDLSVAIDHAGAVVTSDDLPLVLADPLQMTQLFENLIGNALKFSGDTQPRVHVSADEQDSGAWVFTVADNGIGIPAEERDRVFGLFQRLHGRADYPGTGIGLAICRRIVERHGGRIWIETSPLGGTAFRFTLVADTPADPLPDEDIRPTDNSREKAPA